MGIIVTIGQTVIAFLVEKWLTHVWQRIKRKKAARKVKNDSQLTAE